jgi:tetratricopeptide (TPR) repeat protein
MSEKLLAESIRRALDENSRRILVRNMHRAEKFIDVLESVLENIRIFAVDCTDDNSFRDSFSAYFAGDSFSALETAFEAGWRSHSTEVSLYSESSGLEVVAGLHSVKQEVKNFILNRTAARLEASVAARVFSSFAWSLPTVICFVNYTGHKNCPVSMLSSGTGASTPPIVVFSNNSGALEGADAVIESGMLSPEAVQLYLQEHNLDLSPEAVLAAAHGDEGLVKLYTGLYRFTGAVSSHVFSALDSFLAENSRLAVFAGCASVIGIHFLPEEVFQLSGVTDTAVFALGRRINLWSGHITARFSSAGVRDYLLKEVSPEGKDLLLRKAAEVVLQTRGKNSRSYQTAADFLIRSGYTSQASEYYRISAEMATGEYRRADMYRKAAYFSEEQADRFLFLSALNLYRGEFYIKAVEVLNSVSLSWDSEVSVLRGLCTALEDAMPREKYGSFTHSEASELAIEIVESREFRSAGDYNRAERVLLNCSTGTSVRSVSCLVELGEQLYKRGIAEGSLNVMILAGRKARDIGENWLERKALFTCLKAWNRLGRHNRLKTELSRLTELVFASGNRHKLVSVYNLYANSLVNSRKYNEALQIYSSALGILPMVPESRRMRIVILNNTGVVQQMLYKVSEALRTLMQQVRISVSSGNLSQACIAYGNMARIFVNLGKAEAAEDCLETMVEFTALGKVDEASEPIFSVSSQIAFLRDDIDTAISMIDRSLQLSRQGGKKRKLSFGLLRKGSMLLQAGRYREAESVLSEAVEVSVSSGSEMNAFISEMRLTVVRCFLGKTRPVELLLLKDTVESQDFHRGEKMYYHWLFTSSRQSLCSAGQLLSRGLSHGLYFHTYLYMLQKIVRHLPESLADAIPLVHNYPSCE